MSQSALQKPSNQIAEIAVFSKPSWINFAFSYLMMAFVSCITFYGTTIGIKKLHSGWMNLAQKWQNLIGTLWWLKKHNFVPLKFPTWNTTRPDANTIVRVSEIGISSGANLCFAATVADDVRERPDLSGVKLRRSAAVTVAEFFNAMQCVTDRAGAACSLLQYFLRIFRRWLGFYRG